MNVYKFAHLIAFIQTVKLGSKSMLEGNEIEAIGKMITDCVEPSLQSVTVDPNVWVKRSEVSNEVATMMRGMRDYDKIPAIKACRSLTDLGLKEAKDMVEAAMAGVNNKPTY
jgi:ribosomal protein L7/L12